jgi:hypothetical protein
MFLQVRCLRIGMYLKVESLVKRSSGDACLSGEFLLEVASSLKSARACGLGELIKDEGLVDFINSFT